MHLEKQKIDEVDEDALRTGAFWFYRKLGFKPTNPEIEALARGEERRMAAQPGYRSDRRMLRRLSRTEAFLDLSGGKRRPLDFLANVRLQPKTSSDSASIERILPREARLLKNLGSLLCLPTQTKALKKPVVSP